MQANSSLVLLLYKLVTSFLIYRSHGLTTQAICEELSEFLPNLCSYKLANETCKNICSTTNKQESLLKCGTHSKRRYKRIVNGNKSKPNQWPWHISLRLHDEHYCGGSILSKHFILTAEHCIDESFTQTRNAAHFKVIAGLYYRDVYNASHQQIRNVRRIYKHPNYKIEKYPRKDLYFFVVASDLAIIELETPLELNDSDVQTICMPDNDKLIPDNFQCYVVGWGQMAFEDNTSIPNELRFAKIETTPISICNEEKAFNNTVSASNSVCGRGENFTVSPCNKDSGGGLACLKDDRWYLNGVVSSGFKCGDKDAYSLYTNVQTFKPWIIKTLFEYATPTPSSSTTLMGSNILHLILFVLTLIQINKYISDL